MKKGFQENETTSLWNQKKSIKNGAESEKALDWRKRKPDDENTEESALDATLML